MRIRILVAEDEAEIADLVVRGLREEDFTAGRSHDISGYTHTAVHRQRRIP